MGSFKGKLLGLLLCLQCVIQLHGVFFKFTNVTCEVKEIGFGAIVEYCEVKNLGQNKTSLRIRYRFTKPMMNNIWFQLQLMTKSSKSSDGVTTWQPFLYSTNMDLCRVMKYRYNYVAKMIFDLMEGYSNLNHSCPYLEKILAIDDITNTCVSARIRGIPIGKGFYSLYTKWIKENKTLIQTNFYFEVLGN